MNADMSSDKEGESPCSPKTQGFLRNVHRRRVSRPQDEAESVVDGKQVNIPVPLWNAMGDGEGLGQPTVGMVVLSV